MHTNLAWLRTLATAMGIASALALGVAGCDSTAPEEVEEIEAARALWVSQGIRDYVYVLQRGCFCTIESIGPVRITVRAGVVESLVYVANGAPVTNGANLWPTMDGLFDLIERAVAGEADAVVAVYHQEFGYPLTVDIDYLENAIDDELTLTVSSFGVAAAP